MGNLKNYYDFYNLKKKIKNYDIIFCYYNFFNSIDYFKLVNFFKENNLKFSFVSFNKKFMDKINFCNFIIYSKILDNVNIGNIINFINLNKINIQLLLFKFNYNNNLLSLNFLKKIFKVDKLNINRLFLFNFNKLLLIKVLRLKKIKILNLLLNR